MLLAPRSSEVPAKRRAISLCEQVGQLAYLADVTYSLDKEELIYR